MTEHVTSLLKIFQSFFIDLWIKSKFLNTIQVWLLPTSLALLGDTQEVDVQDWSHTNWGWDDKGRVRDDAQISSWGRGRKLLSLLTFDILKACVSQPHILC